jgi:hypothetical protein
MSPHTPIRSSPNWEELIKAMAPDAPANLRSEMKNRLKMTTPSDEAVLGARDFLEDHDYDFDALRDFLGLDMKALELLPTSRRIPTSRMFYRISGAAVLLFALLYGGWRLQGNQRHRLMTRTIFYEPGLPVFAGLGGDRIFHEMMTSFRLEESEPGLKYIDTLEQRYGRSDTLSYYAGWFHYFRKDYPEAASRFELILEDSTSVYFEKSMLMSAATHCLQARKDKAKELLNKIIQTPGHPYAAEAKAMLEDRIWWK